MEKVLLKKEELDTIKEIQQTELNLVDQFGSIEYPTPNFTLQKDNLKKILKIYKLKVKNLVKDLQQKYGDGKLT